ncbi:YbaB/EbfC family nucleoid-associated protein [Saccharomonospora glauca]|uniref:YbaB/EbfC DNA-binding family protein n=1 Tax=Saccharomonospora glauca K62 TaxID=928724 RepID=I1D8B9_9PSEU|nr:YbaB/EbfC family nucleoid-associated protein [Saccharomonospora glauca]EIF01194.1 hypothetical protein SacglDRAFT_04366 [Saccharomonospora glauca K62]
MTTAGNTAAITVTSADGLVTATIGPNGEFEDLEFAPEVFDRTTPAELAGTVLDVIRRAGHGARRELESVARPFTPSDLPQPPRPPRPTPKRGRRAR